MVYRIIQLHDGDIECSRRPAAARRSGPSSEGERDIEENPQIPNPNPKTKSQITNTMTNPKSEIQEARTRILVVTRRFGTWDLEFGFGIWDLSWVLGLSVTARVGRRVRQAQAKGPPPGPRSMYLNLRRACWLGRGAGDRGPSASGAAACCRGATHAAEAAGAPRTRSRSRRPRLQLQRRAGSAPVEPRELRAASPARDAAARKDSADALGGAARDLGRVTAVS